jgi:formylglycine-generating enzyme required for sulfatase activity
VWHDGELGFRLTVDTSAERVLRGGSWLFTAQYARVSNRYGNDPSIRINYLGFRLAKEGA